MCVPRFVSVGEVIVELAGDVRSDFRLSFAGAAGEMAKQMRARLGPDWTIDLFTAMGEDIYSQRIVEDLAASGVGISHVLKVPGRNVGPSVRDAGAGVTSWRAQAA